MLIDERSRHELHTKLDDVLGGEMAATLMAHLPPAGWADVATRHDLAELELRMDLKLTAIDVKLGSVESTLRAEIKHAIFVALVAQLAMIVGVAAAAVAIVNAS